MRRGVTPSSHTSETLVRLLVPTVSSVMRRKGLRRWQRVRVVLVRAVSVKASLAPLTVCSTVGGAGMRRIADLASKATALGKSSNTSAAKPLTSS